jgi:hypothetical protein
MTTFLYYLAGIIIALAFIYHIGKKAGKNEQKAEIIKAEAERTKKVLDNVRNVYNMSDDELADRMQKYGDK